MDTSTSEKDTGRKRSNGMKPLRLIATLLAIAAVVKELRLPKDQRTWHGTLIGFVPYDFRKPTIEKVKATFWNPDAPIIVGRVFGVGWTLNVGAIVAKVRSQTT